MTADRRAVGTKTSAAVVDYVLEQLFSGALSSGDRITQLVLVDAVP